MKPWEPLADLERVLDALEQELLSAGDAELQQELRRCRPSRAIGAAIADAMPLMVDIVTRANDRLACLAHLRSH